MPIIQIQHSSPCKIITQPQIQKIAQTFADSIGKPVERVIVSLIKIENLYYQGNFDPAAFINVASIGKLSAEENVRHGKVGTEVVSKLLGIDAGRILMKFEPCFGCNIAINGETKGALDGSGP